MIEAKELAQILVDKCADAKPDDVPDIMHAFIEELAKSGLLIIWKDIEDSIHEVWKEKFGKSKIVIVSAHPLKNEAKKIIEDFAKGAELHQKVDDRLIGGAVIRVDDTRIDGSITGRLRRLKFKLMQQ